MPEEPVRQQDFVSRVLEVTPKWLLSVFSVAMGASLTFGFMLSVTGLQTPLNRIVSAYAARIESSVNKLETAAWDIQVLVGRLETNEKGIRRIAADLDIQAKRINAIDSRLDETLRRLRDLEAARPRPVPKRD